MRYRPPTLPIPSWILFGLVVLVAGYACGMRREGGTGVGRQRLLFGESGFGVDEDGGTAIITVCREGGWVGSVGVDYAVSDWTATSGVDYLATSGTLTWSEGDTAPKTFTIDIIDDSLREDEESVTLTLMNPTGGAALGSPSTALLGIHDNDNSGILGFNGPVYRVDESGGTASITVMRALGSDHAVTVDYATSDGTATAGSDYIPAAGTLSWADGGTADRTFTVDIIDDALLEGEETVNLSLTNPTGGAVLWLNRADLVIQCSPVWTSSGSGQANSEFGISVASAGDVNGDGHGDVIIGAHAFDTTFRQAGRAYLYLGGPTGLSQTPAWESSGDDQAEAHFGNSVAPAGDVNGDGYDDVVVGASLHDTAIYGSGKAYVYLGGPSGPSSVPGWQSSGDNTPTAHFGNSVASAGDVNGDGYDDVIVGAPGYSTAKADAGKAYLYLGGPAGPSAGAAWGSSGDDQAGALFGYSAASAGDVNGDGYDDVIVGAHAFDTLVEDEGRAYLYLGGPAGLSTVTTWVDSGEDQMGAGFGGSVASAGDVNDDGFNDVIVGAYLFDTAAEDAGKAYVFLGGLTGLSPTPTWEGSGDDEARAQFGGSVATAGDVNADGYDDVIIGAYPGGRWESGRAYVYFGGPAGPSPTSAWNSSGRILQGARFGVCVGTAGDTTGDGLDEVIVGASRSGGVSGRPGTAYVYSMCR